mgnify:CR=1 FL=1
MGILKVNSSGSLVEFMNVFHDDVSEVYNIKEIENGSKVSLRSKNNFDVRKIAENLGGGGHVKAAGITLKNISLEEAEDKVFNEIEKVL